MQNATRETLRLFESRLLTAERSASLDLPFAEFFDLVLRALQAAADFNSCTVWLYSHGVAERVITTDDSIIAAPSASDGSVKGELAEDRVQSEQENNHSGQITWCSRCYEDISRYYALCFEVRTDSDPAENFLMSNAVLALCECLSGWFRRNLIVRMDEKLATQSSITEFCQRTGTFFLTRQSGALIASEMRALLKVDRVSLFRSSLGKSELTGISGTNNVDSKLEVPRSLMALSRALFESEQTTSFDWIPLEKDSPIAKSLDSESRTILGEGGTRQIRVFRTSGQVSDQRDTGEWRIIAELFQDSQRPSESHWKQCIEQINRILLRLSVSDQTKPAFLQRSRKTFISLIVATLLLALLLIPVDFEIDARGRYIPVSEYRVFSPGSGIIQELAVRHELQVEQGMQLLRIHSPELVLKTQEVLGQLETERVRLSSLLTTRLTEVPGGAPKNGVELALGGEQAVRQRISDLESRLQLLKSQESRLVIRAEARGKVFRRQLEQELNSRPVQQGDFLFDMIPSNSRWHLEIDIPEESFSYLPFDGSKEIRGIPARFYFTSEPGERLRAVVTKSEESMVLKDGQSYGIVYAEIDESCEPQTEKHKHPGTSVNIRLHCGRRAVGFVVFREFSEFVREKSFQWF